MIAYYAIGFAYSVLVGHALVAPLAAAMLPTHDPDSRDDPEHISHSLILPPAQGMVERALYTAALLGGQSALIGVWLGLKAVGTGAFQGRVRHIYQRFLIGTAVSLLYAAVGWQVIEWLTSQPQHVTYAVVAALILVIATIALTRYVRFLMDVDDTGLKGWARVWYYTSQSSATLIAERARRR